MNYYNYFSEIEELFIRRRGRNLLLSPLDWALIETWQERGVPLHIVLSAIERVFDGVEKQQTTSSAQKRPIKSIMYCREEIEAQYAAWSERQVGKNGDGENVSSLKSQVSSAKSSNSELFSDETIAAHLEKVSADLKDARGKSSGKLRDCLDEILKRLSGLNDDFQAAENLERTLETLDASIDETLLRGESATDEIKAEIKKQLAAYRGKMEAETYARTFDLMLLKRLRENAGIPHLSLFYL